MTQLTINTTQNVKINFEVASLFSRGIACLLDYLFKFLYGIFILFLWNKLSMSSWFSDDFSRGAFVILLLLPVLFYSLCFEAFMQGTTPGKKLMKLKVIKIDGYQATLVDYLIRWIFRLIDILIGSGIIGVISVVISDKGQRLGDLVAGTAVISIKNTHQLAATIYQELEQEYKPVYIQALQLSDNDIRLIKEILEDFRKTRDYKLLDKLTVKVEHVLGVPRKTPSQLEFINTVLKDYNFLSLQG